MCVCVCVCVCDGVYVRIWLGENFLLGQSIFSEVIRRSMSVLSSQLYANCHIMSDVEYAIQGPASFTKYMRETMTGVGCDAPYPYTDDSESCRDFRAFVMLAARSACESANLYTNLVFAQYTLYIPSSFLSKSEMRRFYDTYVS